MPRFRFRVALAAIAFLILFSILAPQAGGTPPVTPPTVSTDATVDRVEEAWLVLDVPPHPSLPLPQEMAPWAREGDALVVAVQRARRDRAEARIGPVLSPWRAVVVSRGPLLRLRSGEAGSTEFRWPDALAPEVRTGDVLDFRVERAEHDRNVLEGIRASLLGS